MAYPNTTPERGLFKGGWQSPTDSAVAAHMWQCEREGHPIYYRADVWRSGQTIASFTASTLEQLKAELERKYGASGGDEGS
jgi:hypothetical protein